MTEKNRKLVFATGISRSGTTALCELINAHPKACIGVERYKYRLKRDNVYLPEYFDKERFFAFDARDTNILPSAPGRWKKTYRDMHQRFDDAVLVGDKIPDAFSRLGTVVRAFPEISIVWMVRDPVSVASSWQARADDPNDAWPVDRGFMAMASHWREQHRWLVTSMQDPEWASRIFVVDYEGLFSGAAGNLDRLLSVLGLDGEASMMARYDVLVRQYTTTIKSRKPRASREMSEELKDEIGRDLIDQVMALSSAGYEAA